jgi:hypothetical protein
MRHPLDPLNGSENVARARLERDADEKDATIRRLRRELREARRTLRFIDDRLPIPEVLDELDDAERTGLRWVTVTINMADIRAFRAALSPKPAKKTKAKLCACDHPRCEECGDRAWNESAKKTRKR